MIIAIILSCKLDNLRISIENLKVMSNKKWGKFMWKLFIIFCFNLLFLFAKGSPNPGVGSSQLPQLLKNIAISDQGFRVSASDPSFWTLKQDLNSNATDTFKFVGIGEYASARFTINVDKFIKPVSFESYVKRWAKEYPYFGFEILKSQIIKIGGEPCYFMDLAHRQKNKQMRQFVVVKKDFAVVMTCADEIAKFKDTSMKCADLINNFQWTTKSI